MIKLIDNPDEFDTFNKDDIFFIRIMSLLKAYSTEYNFALFYKQIDESENITAIISRLDNDYTDAILTAVSTQSEFRRMGYASALVSAMVCDIKGKVYLMRDKNKNEEFYKKLGFENIGYWRMYK